MSDLVALNEVFTVRHGNKLDLNKMIVRSADDPEAISFVGRSGESNGLAAFVGRLLGVEPYDAGLVTVALGGSALASFVQPRPFYTAQNVDVLIPKTEMGFNAKLYYCLCIEANRFRYSTYGREGNRTLPDLLVPRTVPSWVPESDIRVPMDSLVAAIPSADSVSIPTFGSGLQRLGDLFDMRYGPSLELVRLKLDPGPTGVNFVSRTSQNNGVSARVAVIESIEPDPAGTLSVALGGSVLETFVQPEPWYSGRDIAILTPRREMGDAEKLWWATCIRANRFRYSYGRQANRTLLDLPIPMRIPPWVQPITFEAAEELRESIEGIAGAIETLDNPEMSKFMDLTAELLQVPK